MTAEAWLDATEITRAFLGGDHERALAVADDLLEKYPDRFASFSQIRADLLVQLGRADDALAAATDVLDADRWWSDRQICSLEDEGLVLGAVGEALRARAAEAVAAAARGRGRVLVLEADQPWVSVMVLHMYGVPASETLEVWSPMVDAGVRLVSVESTLVDGDGFPCWDARDLALRDVRIGAAAVPDDVPLVLAGASQGAGLAASAALNGEVRADGWVAVVGAPQPGVATMARLVPGALVAGAEDPLPTANQRTFRDAVTAAGGTCAFEEVPGLGHEYPHDWAARAPRLIAGLPVPFPRERLRG